MNSITRSQWDFYLDNGYVVLKGVLAANELAVLQKRIDAIMLHTAPVDYEKLLMQLDGHSEQTFGSKGATLAYRKIQNLEHDEVFADYLTKPLFRDICRRVYGDIDVTCFRAMFMNKPSKQGTFLPWHQDRWTRLDRDPLLTVWTALDPATIGNGCVQVIPGSHHKLINPSAPSGFLTEQQAVEHCPADQVVRLEMQPGDAVLLHNWLLHASDVNNTERPRRAFSVCYMDARTRDRAGSEAFTRIFTPTHA